MITIDTYTYMYTMSYTYKLGLGQRSVNNLRSSISKSKWIFIWIIIGYPFQPTTNATFVEGPVNIIHLVNKYYQ